MAENAEPPHPVNVECQALLRERNKPALDLVAERKKNQEAAERTVGLACPGTAPSITAVPYQRALDSKDAIEKMTARMKGIDARVAEIRASAANQNVHLDDPPTDP